MVDDALVFAVRDLTSELIALRRQMHKDLEELHEDLKAIDVVLEMLYSSRVRKVKEGEGGEKAV